MAQAVLHRRDFVSFRDWLLQNGWVLERREEMNEMLRMSKKCRKHQLVIYKDNHNYEFLKLQERDLSVYNKFNKEAKKWN